VTYMLVEAYDFDNTVQVGGRSLPALCLVEDDDGVRVLLTAQGDPFPAAIWIKAHTDGAQAILRVEPMSFVLSGSFMEDRTEIRAQGLYSLSELSWCPVATAPSYREMLDLLDGPAETEDLGFTHLHTHAEFSALDGLSRLSEMIEVVQADGQRALAITDHGTCAGHPELQLACDKAGIRPIFGMEAYFVEDRHVRGPEHRYAYQHLVLWAMDDQGLRNLWAMSTESFRTGEYDRKARLDWELLEQYSEGVLASTACLRGPLLHPYLAGDEDRALANLGKLKRIFDDRLYIELHVNHLPEQIKGNEWLITTARAHDVPLIAVVDSHYSHKHDRETHRTWLSVQTNKDVGDDTTLFGGNQDYHLMTGAEVREALAYLDADVVEESVRNTGLLAARCTARIVAKNEKPVYSKATAKHPDRVAHDNERLFDLAITRWEERTKGKDHSQTVYFERFEREMHLLVDKGFCGYFLIQQDMVQYAKNEGVLVGPGRGSGGGSLVAYLIGITEIDPVEADLLFERFMTEGRTSLPDFDIDYPSGKKQFMLDYAARRWGAEHVATVGTHMRLKNKSAINDTARAMKSMLPETIFTDLKLVSKIIDEAEASTAGLGLSWEELWTQAGDLLEPFRAKYPELFEMAGKLHGRLKAYGKHPAGVIIDPDEPLIGSIPLRGGEDGSGMVAQWDMTALEALGYVKFDMLNIRTLDTVQMAADLIFGQTGFRVVPYSWQAEYRDPMIWEELAQGWTLGVFQIETTAGTRLIRQLRPRSVAELADGITLVRPGPKRSGLTDTYFARREGEQEVTYADPRMEGILAKTLGTMLYQEDIMAVTMVLAEYASDEADEVRKILGKKKVELVLKAGEKFVRRAVENGTDEAVARHLWEQMAEFAKYSFNRAHAFAYAIVAYWTAWLKFHYPVQFLCAVLSTAKAERIPEFVEESRRMGYRVLPPDINESGEGFTATGMAVRYGLKSPNGVGDVAVASILANRPFTSWEDFLARKDDNGGKCTSAAWKVLVRVGAFDSLVPNRRGLEKLIEVEAIVGSDRCSWKQSEPSEEPHGLPCGFDWATEPVTLGRTGKPLKAKPPPKKCTKACRQYAPIPAPDPADVTPYTDEDIRIVEMQTLGVYLSSTPFDRIPEEDLAGLSTAVDVLTGASGSYVMAVLVRRVRPHGDRNGRMMGFLTFNTPRGELECVAFGDEWEKYASVLTVGSLAFAVVRKNSRGQSLEFFESLG
jgi:DNA polymerase-3 subunit alpha